MTEQNLTQERQQEISRAVSDHICDLFKGLPYENQQALLRTLHSIMDLQGLEAE